MSYGRYEIGDEGGPVWSGFAESKHDAWEQFCWENRDELIKLSYRNAIIFKIGDTHEEVRKIPDGF
jgi:hypothetical protein